MLHLRRQLGDGTADGVRVTPVEDALLCTLGIGCAVELKVGAGVFLVEGALLCTLHGGGILLSGLVLGYLLSRVRNAVPSVAVG